jgi:phenylpropionate dioxygenase-like ring-hydroxylating dioxygenase large terminal subunit
MVTVIDRSQDHRPDYPLNAWYVCAFSRELEHRLLARRVCNRPLALYRTEAGAAVALEDACWHRLVPLTMGRLAGDEVVCGYHGLRFNSDGRCTHMPSQETLNPAAAVKTYPVEERHGFVWVWPGDPAMADPALIADLHWNDDPEWVGDGRLIEVACDYRLVIDNLMDLTHETYVHSTSIGQEAVAEAPFVTFHGDRIAQVKRWMIDLEEAPPAWAAQMRAKFGRSGRVDRWQIIRFEAPSTITIDVGVADAATGAMEGDRTHGVNGYILNTITPSAQGKCLYFWSTVRNYNLDDTVLTDRTRDAVAGVFQEDELVLEAQQRALDENPGRRLNNLNIDSGGVWARKLIDRMIEAECFDRQAAA